MRVCVQGLWHLGTVTAACLTSLGNVVTGFDDNIEIIDALNQGIPPIFEPGLEELLKQGISEGRLTFSSDPGEAVKDIELLWIAYDTPVDDDDNANVDYVISRTERTLPFLPRGVTVLVSSQMPVGSIRQLESIAETRFPEKSLTFACSPENLRLGKALDVFLSPDRIVVGARSEEDRGRLSSLLRPITDRIEWMSVESAEMTKHAINAFLAISVTFANEIASICELVGADAKEVERGLKSEKRIGPKAYLSPGAAFAGGTLARDISFLNKLGEEKHLSTPLLCSVKASNDEHKKWVKRRLLATFPDISKISVAVWGLTYKPGTDTLRRSMSVELCEWLVLKGVSVHVHDPAVRSLPLSLEKVRRVDNALEALEGVQALVISTEWDEYKKNTPEEIARIAPGILILDANRFLSSFAGNNSLRYLAVGSPGF